MLVSAKKIIGLPAVTKSGRELGKVLDINLKTDSHAVAGYLIKKGWFGKQEYLVSPAQVVTITSRELIVEDAAMNQAVPEKKQTADFRPELSGALGATILNNDQD